METEEPYEVPKISRPPKPNKAPSKDLPIIEPSKEIPGIRPETEQPKKEPQVIPVPRPA